MVQNVNALKEKQYVLEKEIEDKRKEDEVQVIQPNAQISTESIMQDMSQISLKYLEIVGLKNQNKNLENVASKKE